MVDWATYYEGTVGRQPRRLLARALELAPSPGYAVDLGSGSGVETLRLLERGWRVLSIDSEPEAARRLRATVPEEAVERLEIRTVTFEELEELPTADLVHSALSLPFWPPEAFDHLWSLATGCLRPGGLIAADLFGERDTWAGTESRLTFHSRRDVVRLLSSLEIVDLIEEENDVPAFSGAKHWHIFHVFARGRD